MNYRKTLIIRFGDVLVGWLIWAFESVLEMYFGKLAKNFVIM